MSHLLRNSRLGLGLHLRTLSSRPAPAQSMMSILSQGRTLEQPRMQQQQQQLLQRRGLGDKAMTSEGIVPDTEREARREPFAFVRSEDQKEFVNTAPKQDPELYILFGIMAGAFMLVGWYFGRKPTSASSESNVPIAEGTYPWQLDEEDVKDNFKYRYHPGGDKSKPMKEAPSALNVVIVPNVTLPKSLHDQFNKWGKDGF